MTLKKAYILIFSILIIDQVSKIYVKTHFLLQEKIHVTGWFKLFFIENSGMAWGTEIPGDYGKLVLTLFRIIAVFGIGWWLYDSARRKASNYLIVAIALIWAGAFGNIIDSVFYGVFFSESTTTDLAVFMPDQPYGSVFHGKVVDMLYFPFIEDYVLPEWLPIWGGKEFTFFNAIFNFADMAISTGIGILLVFNKKSFAPPAGEGN
ncbi:lipoprotein signal peptidase [Flavobacterium sp.]|uniref:lipoprotein signal peptidase n=1 Tax=Flavobacterium sp. TaxID=239 RepID=UPI002611CC12|nr:lipoprotein signal peptidase [Flavobacterium sp.]